jgi:hypothetical protein
VLRLCQTIRPVPRLCVAFRNKRLVLRWGVVRPVPNLHAGGPATVCCLQLLIRCIHSYPPYVESISSVCNLRTCCAVLTVDLLNMGGIHNRSQNSCDARLFHIYSLIYSFIASLHMCNWQTIVICIWEIKIPLPLLVHEYLALYWL